MSGPNDGGPAFPAPDLGEQDFGQRGAYPGMSVRTYAAIKIMAGFAAGPECPATVDGCADLAVRWADALLAELANAPQP